MSMTVGTPLATIPADPVSRDTDSPDFKAVYHSGMELNPVSLLGGSSFGISDETARTGKGARDALSGLISGGGPEAKKEPKEDPKKTAVKDTKGAKKDTANAEKDGAGKNAIWVTLLRMFMGG